MTGALRAAAGPVDAATFIWSGVTVGVAFTRIVPGGYVVHLLFAVAMAVAPDTVPRSAIVLEAAWTYAAPAGSDVDLFLSILNQGSVPFAVLEVTTEAAGAVASVGLGARGEGGRHLPSAFIVMPRQQLAMRPDQARLRLVSLQQSLEADRQISVVLKCANGTAIRVMVDVRRLVPSIKGRAA